MSTDATAWKCPQCGQMNSGWSMQCGRCNIARSQPTVTYDAIRQAVERGWNEHTGPGTFRSSQTMQDAIAKEVWAVVGGGKW
jgi:predicted ATP-dependent serine protease